MPEQLLESELSWSWKSSRAEDPSAAWLARGLPSDRPLTDLTFGTAAVLRDDFLETDLDDNMRYVTLLAVDAGAILENGEQLRHQLRAFAEYEEAPLRAVILRINDDPFGYVFVPHRPVAPVVALLKELGLIPSVKTRPYGRLRLLQIEESYFYSN